MKYGFLYTAAVRPALHVADCAYNTQQIIAAMRAQAVAGTKLLCLPEFTLTGYTCSDLFLQETLCRGAEDGLIQILDASKELDMVALVGLPVRHNGKLYNCAAVVCKGQLLGLCTQNLPAQLRRVLRAPPLCRAQKMRLKSPLPGSVLCLAPTCCLPAARCRSLCLGWKSVRTFGPLCPQLAPCAGRGNGGCKPFCQRCKTVGKAAYRRELVAGAERPPAVRLCVC